MIHCKRNVSILVVLALTFVLIFTGCAGKDTQKKVAKLDSIESDEETSGGIVSADDIDMPQGEEEEEEVVEDEESIEGTGATNEEGTVTATKNLTVATFNIAAGREVNFDYTVLAADIRNSGADIVALQEVDQMTLRNGSQDTMAILSKESGMQYYAFAPALSPYQEGEYGIGILSKYPIESYMYFELPKLSSKEEQRVLLQAEIDIGGSSLDFFVTHSQSNSITQQLAAANDYISSCSKFIYAGDFNTSNYSYFQVIANSYTIIGSANPILTSAKYSFDNMVISNNIQSSNVRTKNTGHSDHYIVLTDVVIPVGN